MKEAQSFIRYLPEIYQENEKGSFLERFVALFQSLYLEMEEQIDKIPDELDPMQTRRLSMLESWMVVREFGDLAESRRREFLTLCAKLYKSWGTTACLKQVLCWLCGEEPLILEAFELDNFRGGPNDAILASHYGSSPHVFTVILGQNGALYDLEMIKLIKNIIQSMKPVYCDYKLVVLASRVLLDNYTYIGINSRIADLKNPVLDEGVPMTTFILGK